MTAAGNPIPGEPVWGEIERRTITLEMENAVGIEGVRLGVADRPSEVARLLRQAATDIEEAFRDA